MRFLGHSPGAPPTLWGPFASAPAGGARARLKDAAGSGWPQWRSAAAVRGQERSPRGCSIARTGPRTPSDGHSTALPLRPRHSGPLPAGHPRSVPAHPGLPMAPEAGASPRPLPWAALLLLAALLPVASSAGPPGTHMRDSAVGRLSFPLLARLSLWGHCPALTLCSLGACLVTNLCILLGRVRTRWVWALDTLRAGDGLRDTYSTKELGRLQRRPGTSRNQETGTCLGALESKAKERKSDFGHRAGVGGGWGDTFFGQTLPGGVGGLRLSSCSPVSR